MQCPGCSAEMTSQMLDGHYGRTLALDLCAGCGVLWFDADESIGLAPGSILRLFAQIGGERSAPAAPLADRLACPRCHASLERTVDTARGTRFHYFRCPREHGRLITFAEFLREKSFVRPLAPAELAELRAKVRMIQCSSCGAPIDLGAGSACGHCRAPVSMLDPRQVETVVRDLALAEQRRTTVDPLLAARLLGDRLAVDRLFRDQRPIWATGGEPIGLVEAGLAALAGLFASLD